MAFDLNDKVNWHGTPAKIVGLFSAPTAIIELAGGECVTVGQSMLKREYPAWCSAEHGEIWIVTVTGGEEIPCRLTYTGPDFEPVNGHHHYATIARGSEIIEAARRIYPEPVAA